MGKLFRIRHVDNELEEKQPGCVWGLVHAFDYHRWHSKGRKMIAHRKYEGQKQSKSHGSPKQNLLESGEVEKLSDDQERVDQSSKSPRSTKKRSLKARIKALIAEETSRNVDNNGHHKPGLSVPSRLNRTYSIHHLESSDDGLHKIVTEWQNPIIFFPENDDDKENEVEKDTDFFEAFKVDKDLFAKTIEDSNKSARLGKSKSFPAANLLQRRELKPSKLEQKKNETWSFPRSDIIQTGDETISRGSDEYSVRKSTKTHLRSSSLNELVDKYASLFASSDSAEVKLRPSRSLKSINEYGHAQTYFRRIRSLSISHVDYYYPDKKSGVVANDLSADGSNTMLEENEATNGENEPVDTHNHMQRIEDVEDEVEAHEMTLGESDLREDQLTNVVEIIPTKLPEESDFGQCDSDSDYVTHILEKSGIAKNALDITWHSSDQLLSPDLFEEIEDEWPHERSEFNGWPDFYGCWHHRLLFDVVNDVLLQIYNNSFPYYPKALSSSCHVRPVPDGNHFIEQVSTSVGALVNFKPEEKESLDSIVAYNLANDYSWMNLQSESENVALDLEDMIFDELLEEIMLT